MNVTPNMINCYDVLYSLEFRVILLFQTKKGPDSGRKEVQEERWSVEVSPRMWMRSCCSHAWAGAGACPAQETAPSASHRKLEARACQGQERKQAENVGVTPPDRQVPSDTSLRSV